MLTCSPARSCASSARPACICDLTELPPHSYTSVLTCPAARSCATPARSTCIFDLTELPLLLTHDLPHCLRVPWRRRKKTQKRHFAARLNRCAKQLPKAGAKTKRQTRSRGPSSVTSLMGCKAKAARNFRLDIFGVQNLGALLACQCFGVT